MRELTVAVGELDSDGFRRVAPAAPDLGLNIFEAVHDIDARTVLPARDGIEDRLASAFGDPLHDQARLAAFDVHLKVDRAKDRLVQLLGGRREDLKDGRARLRVLAG